MIREIYLIRHGETDWNKEQRYQGQTDIPLNGQGRRQAQRLRESLKERLPFDRIVCSDLSRARETAEILRGEDACPVIADPAFREICFGRWEGMTFSDVARDYPQEARSWSLAPHLLTVPGAESFRELFDRVWPRFLYWTQRQDYTAMAIVCHGAACGALLCGLLNRPLSELVTFVHGNTALNVAEVQEDGSYRLSRLNDLSHLGGGGPLR